MSGLLPLIIQLVSGAVGGNVAGSLFKNLSLGTLWNSVAGIAGGGLGGTILGMLGMGVDQSVGGATDISGMLGSLAGGGVGGGALMAIIGVVRNMMNK